MDYLKEQAPQFYTLEGLRQSCNSGKKPKPVLFWGHRPSKDGSITHSCLSQWWPCEFEENGVKYCCMEQFMMAAKARLFGDSDALAKIMQSREPKTIKDLGRGVRGFDPALWDRQKFTIVYSGNLLKFSQNEELKSYLLSTEDKVLAEASPYDGIWGIKLSAEDEGAKNPYKWRGQNLLGFALMQVRDKLSEVRD